MAADSKDIKQQRDRFLAFSFASADLFMEVGITGTVIFALGAAKGLTGIDDKKLMGRNWLDVFSIADQPVLQNMIKNAKPVHRCGPLAVTLDQSLCGGRKAIVTGIRMPGIDNFYITIGFTNALMEKVAVHTAAALKPHTEPLDRDSFIRTADEIYTAARAQGQETEMTLLDIGDVVKVKETVGDDVWSKFTQAVTGMLAESSIDGGAAAEIGDGRYSIIHDTSISSDFLREQVSLLSKKNDPKGMGFDINSKTITADFENMDERETMKALVYTIGEFSRKGTALNIETLNTGFKSYVSSNAQKVQQFKTMVDTLSFDLHFHPIVKLETSELSHFEMLCRFRGEDSTQEWIIFGEDIGMAADLDMAVCERAINYLLYKSAGRRTKFAINLSGQSIQNEQFFRTLTAKLALHKDLNERIIFELTESNRITALQKVNSFVGALQKQGVKVCLDDFGAGGASFEYLQQLHVDYVKIDGQYTKRLLSSPRDEVMIKNLVRLCGDLNITVISERIERQEQLEKLKEIGVKYGQGFIFGRPQIKPEYDPATTKAA